METYNFEAFPSPYNVVHVALFHEVENAREIKSRLVRAATTDGPEGDKLKQEVDFAFLEARMLASREHLLTAILTTLLLSVQAPEPPSTTPSLSTRSHNLHSEVLLTLAPSNNISDAIRRHGLSDNTTDLVVVRFGDSKGKARDDSSADDVEAVWEGIDSVVRGRLVSLNELDSSDRRDWKALDKVYKLAEMNSLKAPNLLELKKTAITNAVAIKHVT